ncbi:MAG: phosphoribosyl-ATP diphosphatase [Neisseriaceae bacterium]|nr:phosphoribosyl-ATP diphosphatase [Neisseriaceae bacterium]
MNNLDVLIELTNTIENRKNSSESESYVAYLFSSGQDKILKKVIEEAGEVLMASKDNDPTHITKEAADLLFHSMVLLSYHNLSIEDVLTELKSRQNISGLEEKASRNL